MMAKNNQANLQRTLNKGAGGASLTIFVTDCLQGFLKTQKFVFEKVAYL